MVPVISEQNTLFMAAAVIGLEPTFPVMRVAWLPVFVTPVSDRITKLPADKRLTGAGPAASAVTGPTRQRAKETANAITIGFLLNFFIYVVFYYFYLSFATGKCAPSTLLCFFSRSFPVGIKPFAGTDPYITIKAAQ
jgi:hypothetical protein